MTDSKNELKELIEENVSSTQVMSERLGISREDVISIIEELLREGAVVGHLTEDGERFFRKEVKVSDLPVIHSDDGEPDFLAYNSRPAITTSIIGVLVLIIGAILSSIATEPGLLNASAGIIIIGLALILFGGYQIGRRKTP